MGVCARIKRRGLSVVSVAAEEEPAWARDLVVRWCGAIGISDGGVISSCVIWREARLDGGVLGCL